MYMKCFPSDIHAVSSVVQETLEHLRIQIPSLSNDDADELRLVFCELFYNAIIHGNKKDSNKNVHLSVDINGYDIYCVIADEGAGFDHEKHMANKHGPDLTGESGRGVMLAAALTENFAFNSSGNEISFRKRVGCV